MAELVEHALAGEQVQLGVRGVRKAVNARLAELHDAVGAARAVTSEEVRRELRRLESAGTVNAISATSWVLAKRAGGRKGIRGPACERKCSHCGVRLSREDVDHLCATVTVTTSSVARIGARLSVSQTSLAPGGPRRPDDTVPDLPGTDHGSICWTEEGRRRYQVAMVLVGTVQRRTSEQLFAALVAWDSARTARAHREEADAGGALILALIAFGFGKLARTVHRAITAPDLLSTTVVTALASCPKLDRSDPVSRFLMQGRDEVRRTGGRARVIEVYGDTLSDPWLARVLGAIWKHAPEGPWVPSPAAGPVYADNH